MYFLSEAGPSIISTDIQLVSWCWLGPPDFCCTCCPTGFLLLSHHADVPPLLPDLQPLYSLHCWYLSCIGLACADPTCTTSMYSTTYSITSDTCHNLASTDICLLPSLVLVMLSHYLSLPLSSILWLPMFIWYSSTFVIIVVSLLMLLLCALAVMSDQYASLGHTWLSTHLTNTVHPCHPPCSSCPGLATSCHPCLFSCCNHLATT